MTKAALLAVLAISGLAGHSAGPWTLLAPVSSTGVQNYFDGNHKVIPFDLDNFIANLKDRKSFAVFSADTGNPITIRQEPAIEVLLDDPQLRGLAVFRLDVATQKKEAEKLEAEDPGLIMIYSRGKEISRTVGVVDPDKLADLLVTARRDLQR